MISNVIRSVSPYYKTGSCFPPVFPRVHHQTGVFWLAGSFIFWKKFPFSFWSVSSVFPAFFQNFRPVSGIFRPFSGIIPEKGRKNTEKAGKYSEKKRIFKVSKSAVVINKKNVHLMYYALTNYKISIFAQ